MYYICATYDDGKFVECNNVTSISFNGTSSLITVSEENLLTQNIPIRQNIVGENAKWFLYRSRRRIACHRNKERVTLHNHLNAKFSIGVTLFYYLNHF